MLLERPRRNRKTATIRSLVEETRLYVSDLVYPLFVREGQTTALSSLPGTYCFNLDDLLKEIEKASEWGVYSIALFPIIPVEKKDSTGSDALDSQNFYHEAIRSIKKEFPHVCLISDIALDPYTSHGHDGIFSDGEVLNDETVELLAKMAVVQAEAGSDMVAPSDMMDGRVRAIREALDSAGYKHVSIHAYSIKYASAFYGPYRDALSSTPQGDKKSYQLNPANCREALREAHLDELEGADILMVKPAVHYLDIIVKLREQTKLPISAFHTTGEFAMLLAAAKRGWVDRERALLETTLSIKRAGADMIFTYAALEIARQI